MLLSARWTLLVFIAMATRDNDATAEKHEYCENVHKQFVITRESTVHMYLCNVHINLYSVHMYLYSVHMYLYSVHIELLQISGIHYNIIQWKRDFHFGDLGQRLSITIATL